MLLALQNGQAEVVVPDWVYTLPTVNAAKETSSLLTQAANQGTHGMTHTPLAW